MSKEIIIFNEKSSLIVDSELTVFEDEEGINISIESFDRGYVSAVMTKEAAVKMAKAMLERYGEGDL